jgi:capsular polysaccharide export protein
VTRLGFCPGDRLYWSRRAGRFLRCAVDCGAFPAWVERFLRRERPTDIIMLGDGRFYHRETIAAAHRLPFPPRVHIIEHGLIRPGWILVEPEGMGSASVIPQNFCALERFATRVAPDMAQPGFLRYAALDIGYHAVGMALGWLYNRHYIRPGIDPQHREYAGWLGKLMRRPQSAFRTRAELKRMADAKGKPVFLFPLQLETDFQIRDHGHGISLHAHLDRVLCSFAAHAALDALLVIKRHPLDNGLAPWRRRIRRVCAALGIAERVIYLERGALEPLLDAVQGVVTVNSSVGLKAVLRGVPCLTLGIAVYDLPGLTARGSLDRFWTERDGPDARVAARFRDFVLARYHVPGGFDGAAARIGAAALAERICA